MQEYDPKDPKTHKAHDLNRMPMFELYKQYDLNEDTTDFIGWVQGALWFWKKCGGTDQFLYLFFVMFGWVLVRCRV